MPFGMGDRPDKGVLQPYMQQAVADKLGLTVTELEAKLADGTKLHEVVLATGVTLEEMPTFMSEVQATALAAAVKDGVLTQAQADEITARMQERQSHMEQQAVVREYVQYALADALDITVSDLETQIKDGKKLHEIVLASGVTQEELPAFFKEIHETALAQAVKDGALTQAQADEILQHMQEGFGRRGGPRGPKK